MATAAVVSMSEQFRDESAESSKGDLKDQDIDLDSNANQHPDQDSGKKIDTSHVTIQLSQSLHSNQQKMEELIAHLSQSGQLKDDRKITIEVKDSDVKEAEKQQEKNPVDILSHQSSITVKTSQQPVHAIKYVTVQQAPSTPSSYTQKSAYVRTANGPVQVKGDPSGQSVSVQGHGDGKSPATYQVLTPNSSQQIQTTSNSQQPAYILIPASQQAQQISVAPLNSVASTPIRVVNQGGQHIILQQTNTTFATSTPISSFSLKTASMVKGERNVVVLQQQHQNPVPIVPVRSFSQTHNNRLPPAPPSIAAAATSANFSPNATSSSVRVSRGSNLNSTGKESSWQQYVKQFEKLGPCPICGDKISGYHYGIFCCESCKGFFKRTVQNSKRYACHMATPASLCEITATSRKKCPACRFVKCLEKGMRMEAIRTDRTRGGRSMYPGSRYLRQLAARASGSASDLKVDVKSTISAATSASLPNIAPLPNNSISGAGITSTTAASTTGSFQSFGKLEAGPGSVHIMSIGGNVTATYEIPASEDVGGGVYLDPAVLEDPAGGSGQSSANFQYDAVYRLPSRTQEVSDLPQVLREILKVEEDIETEPEEKLDFENTDDTQTGTGILPANVTAEEAAVYRALLNLADQRLYRIVRWSRGLPVFSNLDTDDQILLLQNCWADLLCLDCCWKSLPTPSEIRLTSTKCINLEAAREMGAEALVDNLLRLTQDLKRLRFSMLDFACLKVCLLMQPGLANLKAVNEVKQFQQCVNQLLMNYLTERNADVPNKFSELFVRVPDLQRTSTIARELLADKDLSPYLSANSLLMELLRSDFHRQPSGSVAGGQGVALDTSEQVATTFLAGNQGRNDEQGPGERHRVFQTGDSSETTNAYSANGPL
ncbi:hypothetical protein ACTXT7_006628 [Hymenolepis weldensis]